ncbi:ghrelin O-acyltransferase [Latimeria chalumnae]|uniref:Ghrelin O-acyltransferase n=1 Tax=Latimeria chalumnae TaxID=7897 RepID=A0A1S7UE55_LATCH|nr:TPA_inf: ghrelin O-acyltransferase [Latimeria chalumnae]
MDLSIVLSYVHPVTIYQLVIFPFAVVFYYLCIHGSLSVTARYAFLLVGGFLLSNIAMGTFSLLVLIPAVLSVIMMHSISPQSVHRWVFLIQMLWQTLCHLWLQYKEHSMQEITRIRFIITISSLMLLTQRVTTLALDIHEGKIKIATRSSYLNNSILQYLHNLLPYFSYMIYFPALLGGPLLSFQLFKIHIETSGVKCTENCSLPVTKKFCFFLALELLKFLIRNKESALTIPQSYMINDIFVNWRTALLFKLTYYSHWILSESLLNTAGFGFKGYDNQGILVGNDLTDTDICTLETTNKISQFARAWNKTTAEWLRRLVFQRCTVHPLFVTFAFSAWWHGLHPGQIFGFLFWSVAVEADKRVHYYLAPLANSWFTKQLFKVFTWIQTQLVIACIMMAIENKSFSSLWLLSQSCIILFPLLYCLVLLLLPKRPRI